jgi:oligosaccharide repeat unit polymerase
LDFAAPVDPLAVHALDTVHRAAALRKKKMHRTHEPQHWRDREVLFAMSSLDCALLFFLLLVGLNYRVQRSALYPPFLFCAMWLLVLSVLRSGLIEVDLVNGNTLEIVAAGAASFSLGGFLAVLVPGALLRIHLFSPTPARHPSFLRNMVMLVLLCGLPVLIYQIYQLSESQGGGVNIFAQARLAQLEAARNGETGQSFVLDYFTMIATYVSLLFATERRDKQFWIVTAVAFCGCIFSTGRTNLLMLISGLCTVRLLQTKRESFLGALLFLRWPITLFLALYVGLIFTNKQVDGAPGGFTGVATYFVLSYIVGPLAAFDRVVQHPADFALSTSHTFEFPMKVASALNLTSYTAPPLLDKFVFVPFPTNVYTIYKFYFLELGTIGTVTLLLFIGFLHSLLYLKAKRGGRLSTYLFAFSMYFLLMVIFDDSYYQIGVYLRALAFGLVYLAAGSIPFRLLPALKANHRHSLDVPPENSTS